MKTLLHYILEAQDTTSKSFIFNFNSIDTAESIVSTLSSYDYVTIDGLTVIVNISKENVNDIDALYETLSYTIDTIKSKIASPAVHNLSTTFEEMTEFIDKLKGETE